MAVKIGIIGTDGGSKSGHAVEICKIIAGRADAEVTAIFGEDSECTRELYETGTVRSIANTPEELAASADAVMILNRDGRKHKKYALPLLEQGMPVFIDKPMTCDIGGAVEIVDTAKRNNAVLAGGSYMKYSPGIAALKNGLGEIGNIQSGYFSFPIFLNSEHGGLHFYSHHLIEEMLEVFGEGIESISASVTACKLTAVAHYPDFPVIMNYSVAYPAFYAAVYGDRTSMTQALSADGLDAVQVDKFIRAVREGRSDFDCGRLVTAVKISCALERAIRENARVEIE